METRNIVGISLAVLVVIGLVLTISMLRTPKTTTGAASAGGPVQGFSSYEEMMEAHHGKKANAQSQGVGGCGSEAPVASHDSPFQGNGEKSEYGITYDQAGYGQLMELAKSITLSSEQTDLIVGLDVTIPCCGFKTLQASGNCECGHHVALEGLAKLLASKDYSKEQIQTEINKWKEVFFPNGGGGNTGGC